ncbi:MAG: hypothetical protein A2X03_04390 [Bacteroidetes bacterium GWA2_40_15]|nr:MAG: hypothetical protein A2X03_04390 [Bacteroidetes bacterium GWA2_40_15]HBQ82187.1 DUF3108 domain-containing protein [Bacteroidales bacterium]
MKRFISITIFATMTFCSGWCQTVSYMPGESVNYSVHYGPINAGIASLEIKQATYKGMQVWHTKLFGKTTGMADALFKVVDIYESYIDPETELPVFTIRNIREGRYRKYNEVIFDHKTRADSAILTSDLTGVHIVQKGMHDILSCFYHFRDNIMPDKKELIEGEIITINTWFTDELYPVRLKYVKKEEVKTKLGKIMCYKFNPVTETGRLFKTDEDVSFWFSADKNYLPVKIRFDIFVGAFTVEMTNYEGLAYPVEIKNK